ncbi:MAG TPA: hypothetical protein VEV17_09610 [Bryobacteraceae bacterium]|nr:hypothetical protein [Bryobacteraceae bacterium]
MEYDVEDELIAVVTAATRNECPSYTWNTFELPNGAHVIKAIARDALNNVLATSADQAFTIQNSKVCSDGNGFQSATIAVSTGTSISSPWSGDQTITVSKSGTECAGAGTTRWQFSIDGAPAGSLSGSGGTATIGTKSFYNGNHLLAVVAYDPISTCTTCNIIGSWQRLITFSNTSSNLAPVEMRLSADRIVLTPTGSANNCNGGSNCTITGTEYANDGSTTARIPQLFAPNATGVISVSSNVVTETALGTERVFALDPWYTSTTLATSGSEGGQIIYDSAAPGGHFFDWQSRGNNPAGTNQSMKSGWCVSITSSTGGWVPGLYVAAAGGISFSNSGLFLTGPLPSTAPASLGNGSSGGHGVVGPCTELWVTVASVASIPHFTRNGQIRTSYLANSSIFSLSLFNSGFSGQYSTADWADSSVAAGWNVIEIGLGCPPGNSSYHNGTLYFGPRAGCQGGASQAQWQTDYTLQATNLQTDAQTHHYYLRTIGTSWANSLFTFVGSGQLGLTYSPPAFQYASQTWGGLNQCTPSFSQPCYGAVHSMSMNDEVDGVYGNVALPGATFGSSSNCGQIGGTCGPTQIVASSGTCTTSWQNGGINPSGNFIIQGATTTSLNTNYNRHWSASSVTLTQFIFGCSGVPDGTYNAATDPNLTFNIFADGWGSPADYLHYNALSTFMAQANAAIPARPRISWPPRGIAPALALQNWLKDARMSDYAEIYYPSDLTDYGTFNTHIVAFPTYQGRTEFFQSRFQDALADGAPWCGQAQVTLSNYSLAGTSFSVTSFSGDTVTVSGPHGFVNVIPGITRVTLSGMSNSADNGSYMVRSFPTATTIQLLKAPATGGGTHTLTFSNGDVRTGVVLNDGGALIPLAGNMSGCWNNDLGLTFAVSGASGTFYFSPASNLCMPGQAQAWDFYQLPIGSSTSGSIAIQPDNYYHLGTTPGSQLVGPRFAVASQMVLFHLGASCARGYSPSIDPDWIDSGLNLQSSATLGNSISFQVFNPQADTAGTLQAGTHPSVEQGVGSVPVWWAQAIPNLMIQRFACYTLGNRLASPDYGLGFLASARAGSCGNIFFITNFWDYQRTQTVTLTPYLVSGQPIWKYYCTMIAGCTISQLSAGTNTDTVTFDPIATAWYIFANNASAEVALPGISVRLADVPNATKVVVAYGYTQYALSRDQVLALPFVADCGTGACLLPVDRLLGPIYYQIRYVDSNGRLLAMGSETL